MQEYDVVIIGGGVSGCATSYILSNYTDIKKIALFEKYEELAKTNSNHKNNSQTLHFGDIETNYTLEKATKVKHGAEMVVKYVKKHNAKETYTISHKMVLAVGKEEVKVLEKRHKEFNKLFPDLKKLSRQELKNLEPNVINGRSEKEEILALCTKNGYIMDYGKLAKSFVENSKIDLKLNHDVTKIEKNKGTFVIHCNDKKYKAKSIVVATGPHSLLFAQNLGYGKEYGVLPVAGNFYYGNKLLNGKVYTMQLKKLPFAAVHGDPEVDNPNITRFGPTVRVIPMLERHNYSTIKDFLKTSVFTWNGFLSLFKIMSDYVYLRYIFKQILYDIPFIGKRIFIRDSIRKIIPSIKAKDLKKAKGYGGVRPQVVDTKNKQMNLGEAKIKGENILFDITPSPGASICLKNAENNAKIVCEFLGVNFDAKKHMKDYY